jgi:hypothetical protein
LILRRGGWEGFVEEMEGWRLARSLVILSGTRVPWEAKERLRLPLLLVEVACANRAGISAGHDDVLCWHGMRASATSLVSLCYLSLLYCPMVGGREREDETFTWVR